MRARERVFRSLLVITKCGLHRKPGQRTQVGIHFLEIHALEAARFRSGQLNCSGAFDKNFAGFALRVPEAEKGCVAFVAVIDFSMEIRNCGCVAPGR